MTNECDLPQDMITHNCEIRKFLSHLSGSIDKGQLGYQVFRMTAIYFRLTSYNFNILPCTAKWKRAFARA